MGSFDLLNFTRFYQSSSVRKGVQEDQIIQIVSDSIRQGCYRKTCIVVFNFSMTIISVWWIQEALFLMCICWEEWGDVSPFIKLTHCIELALQYSFVVSSYFSPSNWFYSFVIFTHLSSSLPLISLPPHLYYWSYNWHWFVFCEIKVS